MKLPSIRSNPIAGKDTQAMAELTWEWICWLKDWRALYEQGELGSEEANEEELENYFSGFLQGRGFISVAESYSEMPSDARVDFVYIPTVTAASILNLVRMNSGSAVCRKLLKETVTAACGRKLMGHGYDGGKYMAYQLELLAYGQILSENCLHNRVLRETVLHCHRKMTSELVDPHDVERWSGVDRNWTEYCLRLLNCNDNNWQLLLSSPLTEDFERALKPRALANRLDKGDLLDE